MAIYDANRWLKAIILDDEEMTANSENQIVSQRSIVAYVANQLAGIVNLTEAQVQALIGASMSTLSSNDIIDFDTAVNAVVASLGIVTQTTLTAQLNQNTIDSTTYTDQEIAKLFINSDKGFPEWQQDLWLADSVPITSMKVKKDLTEPDFVKFTDDGNGSVGLYTYAFTWKGEDDLSISWVLNPRWRPGSDIYPAVRWMAPEAGDPGDRVTWTLEYHVRDFMDPLGNSTLVESTSTQPDEDYIANKLYVNVFPPIEMSSYQQGSMPEIVCRLSRTKKDDYPEDALLMCFGFIFRISRPGCGINEFPVLYPDPDAL